MKEESGKMGGDMGARGKAGRADRGVRPYGNAGGLVRAGGVEPRPYGGVQEVRRSGASGTPPPTEFYKKCGGRADVGIGPTDALLMVRWVTGGGVRAPRPTEGLQEVLAGGFKGCGGENESPSHGFDVPAPFRQGDLWCEALQEVRRSGASGTPPPTGGYK